MDIASSLGLSPIMKGMKKEAIRIGLAKSSMPTTGLYTLDLTLCDAPKQSIILIAGRAASGKTIIAKHLYNCWKDHFNCKLIDEEYEDYQTFSWHDYDYLIRTCNVNRHIKEYTIDQIKPLKLTYMASHTFLVEKLENRLGVMKITNIKNRYIQPKYQFFASFEKLNDQFLIEEL